MYRCIYFIRKIKGKEKLFFIKKDVHVIKQGFIVTIKGLSFPNWKRNTEGKTRERKHTMGSVSHRKFVEDKN